MRKIKRIPHTVVFYHVFDIIKQEDRLLGPYCKIVNWPKGMEKFYTIKDIIRKEIK